VTSSMGARRRRLATGTSRIRNAGSGELMA
jgi:hypothetical protein